MSVNCDCIGVLDAIWQTDLCFLKSSRKRKLCFSLGYGNYISHKLWLKIGINAEFWY